MMQENLVFYIYLKQGIITMSNFKNSVLNIETHALDKKVNRHRESKFHNICKFHKLFLK